MTIIYFKRPSEARKDKDFLRSGATGFGTQTLLEYFWNVIHGDK